MSDLSAYEIARLQRIKENKAVLSKIGLQKLQKKSSTAIQSTTVKTIKKREREKRKRTERPPQIKIGIRRSKRLKGLSSDGKSLSYDAIEKSKNQSESEEETEPEVDYLDGHWPQEAVYLDDFEFQIYAELRKWRLKKKNELQIEAYKIFQNRTLCELIRRRRNDINYCISTDESKLEEDLLKCWGIGKSKAREGGFGREVVQVMQNEDIMNWFEESRKL